MDFHSSWNLSNVGWWNLGISSVEEVIRTASIALITSLLLAVAFFGGHQSGAAKRDAHWLEIENATLREKNQEITRQVQAVAAKQKEYNDAQIQINDFAVRLNGADRLRIQAEHRSRIDRAEANSLRIYAANTLGLFETCRKEYIELGLEAARASASAGALK
jgi:hypothetical protein